MVIGAWLLLCVVVVCVLFGGWCVLVLVSGCWLLVVGGWWLMVGYWLLCVVVDGGWWLVVLVLGCVGGWLSWFLVLGSCFLVPGSCFLFLGSWFLVLGCCWVVVWAVRCCLCLLVVV